MTIENIISGCKLKNRKAEKALYQAFSPYVLQLCLRYSKDNAQAKDYLQECFIHLFNKLNKYDNTKGAFKSWMTRLCINKVLEIKRKEKTFEIELNLNHFPEEAMITEEEFEYIHESELLTAIRKLPDGYRNVINLYVMENLSHAEIGKLLNITDGASRSQLSRGKLLLKIILIQSIPNIYEKRLA